MRAIEGDAQRQCDDRRLGILLQVVLCHVARGSRGDAHSDAANGVLRRAWETKLTVHTALPDLLVHAI
jgi:hypothetical protein